MFFPHIFCYDEYGRVLDYTTEDVFDIVAEISTTPQCTLAEWAAFNHYMDTLGYIPVKSYVTFFASGTRYFWDENTLEYYFVH